MLDVVKEMLFRRWRNAINVYLSKNFPSLLVDLNLTEVPGDCIHYKLESCLPTNMVDALKTDTPALIEYTFGGLADSSIHITEGSRSTYLVRGKLPGIYAAEELYTCMRIKGLI